MSMFKPATREKLKLRMALCGPSGSGKTYTALRSAFALAGPGGKVAVIDTEHRSASKYQGDSPDGFPWQFDVCELEHYAPSNYTQVIKEAGRLGYDVIVIDSLSHAWEGVGGALDQVDSKAKKSGNSFTAWADVTPQHRDMVEAILSAPCHVIVTMRSKMDYAMEKDEKTGKTLVKKIGMAPIQRQGMEYEFDVVCDLDQDHLLVVSKSRCSEVDGQRVSKPGPAFMEPVKRWLNTGAEAKERPAGLEEKVIAEMTKPTVTLDTTKPTADEFTERDPSRSPTLKCSESQRAKIVDAAKRAGLSPADLKPILAKKGCDRLSDLSGKAAQGLIDALEKKALEAAASSTF